MWYALKITILVVLQIYSVLKYFQLPHHLGRLALSRIPTSQVDLLQRTPDLLKTGKAAVTPDF